MKLKSLAYAFILFSIIGISQISHAQVDARYWEDRFAIRNFHFGILLGFNQGNLDVAMSSNFTETDSVLTAKSIKGPGFNLGIVSNLHINKHWDLRVLPQISFGEKQLLYTSDRFDNHEQLIEVINFEMPVILKYKSKPYKDMRVYVLGGMRYANDLASNAQARNASDLVKLKRHDFSFEYGFGLELYFPMFILAPEIRFSRGLTDIHSYDNSLIYSRVLGKLLSRGFTFTFHFEG